jgi:hypothetical protein
MLQNGMNDILHAQAPPPAQLGRIGGKTICIPWCQASNAHSPTNRWASQFRGVRAWPDLRPKKVLLWFVPNEDHRGSLRSFVALEREARASENIRFVN